MLLDQRGRLIRLCVDLLFWLLANPFAPVPLQDLHCSYESVRPLTEFRYCRAYEVFSLVTSRFASPLKFPRFQRIACTKFTPPVRRVLLRQSRVTPQLTSSVAQRQPSFQHLR